MRRAILTGAFALLGGLTMIGLTVAQPSRNEAPVIPAGASFIAYDLFVDTGGAPLAAYQLELLADAQAEIVGVEGGQPGPFSDAPFYDPRAMAGNKVIVGAFSTAQDVPTGKTRVATVHMLVPKGVGLPRHRLTEALSPDEIEIEGAVLTVQPRSE